MEIITGVERRRRWSSGEKLRIVAETEQPGAGIAEIARRYEISRGLLWNWRSQVRRGTLRAWQQKIDAKLVGLQGADVSRMDGVSFRISGRRGSHRSLH